jgi:hypothetical protein
MNVEIETEAAQFPEKEYINGSAVAVYGMKNAPKQYIRWSPRLAYSES